jgi:hypothetical protein
MFGHWALGMGHRALGMERIVFIHALALLNLFNSQCPMPDAQCPMPTFSVSSVSGEMKNTKFKFLDHKDLSKINFRQVHLLKVFWTMALGFA